MQLIIDLWSPQLTKTIKVAYSGTGINLEICALDEQKQLIAERHAGVEAFWELYDNQFKAQITPPLDDAPSLRPQFQPPEIATISLLDAQIMIEALRKSNASLLSNLSPEQRAARPFLEVLAQEMPTGIIIRLIEGNQILLSHHFVLAEKHRWIELNLDPRGELQPERFDQFELQFNWVQTFQIDQLIVTKMVNLVEKAA